MSTSIDVGPLETPKYEENLRTARGGALKCAPYGKKITVRWLPADRKDAGITLAISPIAIPLKAVVTIISSLVNIISFGSVAVLRGRAEKGVLGRLKSVGRSVLSIVLTPASMAVEGISCISHLIKPETQKIDYLAAKMWTGGLVSGSLEEDVGVAEKTCHKATRKLEQNDIKGAVAGYEIAARRGNIEAMARLGDVALLDFEDHPKNEAEARGWYIKAAYGQDQPHIYSNEFRARAFLGLAKLSGQEEAKEFCMEAAKFLESEAAPHTWSHNRPIPASNTVTIGENKYPLEMLREDCLLLLSEEMRKRSPSKLEQFRISAFILQELMKKIDKEDILKGFKNIDSQYIDKEEKVLQALVKDVTWAPVEVQQALHTCFRGGATVETKGRDLSYICGLLFELSTPPQLDKAIEMYDLVDKAWVTDAAYKDANRRAGRLAEKMAQDPHIDEGNREEATGIAARCYEKAEALDQALSLYTDLLQKKVKEKEELNQPESESWQIDKDIQTLKERIKWCGRSS